MRDNISVGISETALSLNEAFQFVSDAGHGAVSNFIGVVRDHNLGKKVNSVSYDVADELAIAGLTRLSHEAIDKWGTRLRIYIRHFKGNLPVSGASVIIACSSPHRAEATQACQFLIEAIKHQIPIWKKEYYESGESDWVEGHALCAHH